MPEKHSKFILGGFQAAEGSAQMLQDFAFQYNLFRMSLLV